MSTHPGRSIADHDRLARGFALFTALAFVVGGFLAVGLAARPLGDTARQDPFELRAQYTLHGLWMVFLVALPIVPGVFGNALLPRALGLSEMAWPRTNRLAFHLYLSGFAVFVVAAIVAPADTGWSMDPPYALAQGSGVWWSGVGILILCASSVCSGANVVATFVSSTARERGRGRTLFAWSLLAGSAAQALGAIVLSGVVFLLLAERGGASSLWSARVDPGASYQAWFWLAVHATLSAVVVVTIGLVAEVVEAARGVQKEADPVTVAALGAALVAGAAGYGMHLPGRDASGGGAIAASALALVSGAPFVVLFVGVVRTLTEGPVRPSSALAWALAALGSLCTGGVAALALALLPTATWLEHTTYPTGVLHLVFAGGIVSALIAGVHHLWRGWFGVEPGAGWARLSCFLWFTGVHLSFLPALVLGAAGNARRGGPAAAGGELLGALSAAGSFVLATAAILAAWNLVRSVAAAPLLPRAGDGKERVA